jgi:hypothetical protein
MRLAILGSGLLGLSAALLSGCVLDPTSSRYDPRYPTQTSENDRIDPYHRDKTPDTPYEVRKGEMERDDHIAGRTGPTYPPLFKDHTSDAREDGDT